MKEYSLTDTVAILDFKKKYCTTATELLSSNMFREVFSRYVDKIVKKNNVYFLDLLNLSDSPKEDFLDLFKIIYVFDMESISEYSKKYEAILRDREKLSELIEDFYDFWRHFERYGIVTSKYHNEGLSRGSFYDTSNDFTALVLNVYRTIAEKVIGHSFGIYRHLPSGVNASLQVEPNNWMEKDSIYSKLENVLFIKQILVRPPFIVYSKANKRVGVYQEVYENPISKIDYLNTDEYFCFPIYVGSALAYVYFHKNFMQQGVSLANLFEFAAPHESRFKKPDLIYVYGANLDGDSVYYHDIEENIYVGVAPLRNEFDYFGYMKKMLLTLYNVSQINEGYLPVHGACVHFTMPNREEKTVVMIGDSGAGKSESLEALKNYAGDRILREEIIFDDMGTLRINDGEVFAYGTETGAFVRLDDLDNGYAFAQMDRAIFTNPDKQNARVIIPANSYKGIMKGHKVDFILYANNYTDNKELISFFDSEDDAINTFKDGSRVAKGTTGEIGLVKSYFANPFGPVQNQQKCDILIQKYFDALYKHQVVVGQMYTKLAIAGYEHKGPKMLSSQLFSLLNKNKKY